MSLLLRKNKLWGRIEEAILEVIELAIDLFLSKRNFPIHEDDLNRKFYFCLVSANYQLQKQNRGLESPPFYEGNNQPSSDDVQRASREAKRPDFQWSITDISEPDPEKSSKQFVLECKRLGKPVGTWILNENYVKHGIKRFIDKDHGYAHGVESSAMLGYIQDMDVTNILDAINREVKLMKQPLINNQINRSNHIQLSHRLSKSFPLNEIEVKHIWIEIPLNIEELDQ